MDIKVVDHAHSDSSLSNFVDNLDNLLAGEVKATGVLAKEPLDGN